MIKRYEWQMVSIERMDDLDREGWEYVSGPLWQGGFACLMRREVVPGRVHLPDRDDEPRETGTWDDGPLRNCWTCVHSTPDSTGCKVLYNAGVMEWVRSTHPALTNICPDTADGCPGWTAKEVTP